MARPKKTFTEQEAWWSHRYIERKFKLDMYWPKDDYTWKTKAQKAFNEIRGDNESAPLQSWCDQWLDDEQRKQLLSALRAWKKRKKTTVPKKTISLDYEAWLYMSTVANRDKVTISQLLISRFQQEYMDIPVNDEVDD